MPQKKTTATGVLGGLAGLAGLSAVAGVLVAATVTPAIAVSGVAASSAISLFDNMPSELEIEDNMQQSTFWVGDQVLAQFYDQNRIPVTFDQVNSVMYDAVLSSEDPRYYQHGGVDLIGTTRALLSNAQGGATQGGSSISQQYVKNVLIQDCERNAEAETEMQPATDDNGDKILDENGEEVLVEVEVASRETVLQNCWTEATNAIGTEGYQRKLQEMRYAIQLEKKYSKNEILLGYLNIANFGGTTYGIEAAAKRYFNTTAAQLTIGQAATLAGIVQNPNTYRVDKPGGSIAGTDGVMYNKEADGSIDDVDATTISALNTLVDNGTITAEQRLAAADAYSATKGRQLYVLSRLLDDGKITQEQYVQAAIEPIVPAVTETEQGCGASAAPYFCQYVLKTVLADEAFGETATDRLKTLRQDGLNIYTTLDWNMQNASEAAMDSEAPTSIEGMQFGATSVSIDNTTGRILSISQNTEFSEDAANSGDPNYSSLVYAGDLQIGGARGFNAGSTFKLFTLIDWLENGHSVNESVNGRDVAIKKFPSSCGDITNNTWKPGNFGGGGGGVGTPMSFTASSLNSGYVAMAAQLDLCSIGKVATKMGVTSGTGEEIVTSLPNQIIGSDNVSPIAMAGAYGTVANGGVYCQPKVIDRVTDNSGEERPIPETTCSQVITPEVAAAAALALSGVMRGSGTGAQANPNDGTPLLGKTGTHQQWQSWMIESSTKVATAVWVGNSEGENSLFNKRYQGTQLSNIRYELAEASQRVANEVYGGDAFSTSYGDLTRQVLKDVPNVVGQTVEQAQATLTEAGWEVAVGEPVDSDQPTNIIAQQDPSGRAATGVTITIRPSNGQAAAIPSVAGSQLEQAAAALVAAGFSSVSAGTCTVDANAQGNQRVATGTNPAAGTVTGKSTAITVDYTSKSCP